MAPAHARLHLHCMSPRGTASKREHRCLSCATCHPHRGGRPHTGVSALACVTCQPHRIASLHARRHSSRTARQAAQALLLSLHAILRIGMVGTPQGHRVILAHDILSSQPTRDEVVRQVQTAVVLRVHAVEESAVVQADDLEALDPLALGRKGRVSVVHAHAAERGRSHPASLQA